MKQPDLIDGKLISCGYHFECPVPLFFTSSWPTHCGHFPPYHRLKMSTLFSEALFPEASKIGAHEIISVGVIEKSRHCSNCLLPSDFLEYLFSESKKYHVERKLCMTAFL